MMLRSALALVAALQGPPATDIYVADLTQDHGTTRLSVPRNVTHRPGYDNQPTFLPSGGAFLYTCAWDDGQTDICRYDLVAGKSQRLTTTLESEYSAAPLADGGFAVVRVERDSTQRLWTFDSTGVHASLLLERVKGIGYFAFADERIVGLFVLGRPPTFQVADVMTGAVDTVASDIGRTLRLVPGKHALSFIRHASETEWWITSYDVETRVATPLVRTLEGVDFYTWAPGGRLLAGGGSKVFQWTPGARDWQEIADLSAAGLTSITRLAVSPRGDRIAIVAIPDAPDTP